MPVLASTLNVQGHVLHVVSVKDRRGRRPHRETRFVFARQIELVLWGSNSGALSAMLHRMSMASSTMTITRASIGSLVTDAEFAEILGLFQALLPIEGRLKVRNLTLVPTPVAVAVATQFGRCDSSVALLRALNSLPTRWAQEMEQEANEAAGEFDLVLQEALEEDQDTEHLDMDLGTELLMTELPYKATDQCEAKVANLALSPVPASVEKELAEYEAFRNAPFNRFRAGAMVVSTTIDSDKANALRWLGYVKTQFGQPPSVKLFASPSVAEWSEAWVTHLKNDLGLKASTLAVYLNGVIAVSGFALTLVDAPDACPVEQLVNLRRQAESLAKEQRLFEVKSKHWISWLDAQQTRVTAIEKYHAATDRGKKQTLLRECMLLAFSTLQPPDRVGVVRRLRLGDSLYKKEGEAEFTVDLSNLRHKTSRFYGPSISTLPTGIGAWVAKYLESIELEFTGDTPYLFSLASDWQRGMSSSQWCAFHKGVFLKHGGVAVPPKLLRASFCTHLRSAEGVDDELLESCAKAMKHLKATGGSDNYDKAAHDRLLAKAHAFCAKIASDFQDPAPKTIAIPGTFTGVLAPEQTGETKTFLFDIPWHGAFYPNAQLMFPATPPLDAVKFKVPKDIVEGRSFQLRLQIPRDAMTLKGLQLVSGPKPSGASSSKEPVSKSPRKGKEKAAPAVSQEKKSRALKQLEEYFESGPNWLATEGKRRR